MFKGPLFQFKLYLLSIISLNGFQSSRDLWNPMSQAVPGKFHGSDGHSKRNYLQDRANFHTSEAWQIVPIFNTAIVSNNVVISLIWSHACETWLQVETLDLTKDLLFEISSAKCQIFVQASMYWVLNVMSVRSMHCPWKMWLWFQMCKLQTQPENWYLEYSSKIWRHWATMSLP